MFKKTWGKEEYFLSIRRLLHLLLKHQMHILGDTFLHTCRNMAGKYAFSCLVSNLLTKERTNFMRLSAYPE